MGVSDFSQILDRRMYPPNLTVSTLWHKMIERVHRSIQSSSLRILDRTMYLQISRDGADFQGIIALPALQKTFVDFFFQHFYFSHRPSPLLRGRRLSGSWEVSVLSRFSVGFWSVLLIFDRNLTKNWPKVDPLQGVRSECAVYEGWRSVAVLKPTGSWEEVYRVCQIARAYCLYLKKVKFCFRCLALLVSEFHRWFVAMSVRDPQGQTDGNCIRAECLTVFWELQCAWMHFFFLRLEAGNL